MAQEKKKDNKNDCNLSNIKNLIDKEIKKCKSKWCPKRSKKYIMLYVCVYRDIGLELAKMLQGTDQLSILESDDLITGYINDCRTHIHLKNDERYKKLENCTVSGVVDYVKRSDEEDDL